TRDFIRRQNAASEFTNRLFIEFCTGVENDRGDDFFTGMAAGQPDDGGICNGRMLTHRVLDFGGGDIEPTGDDEFFDPVDDSHESGFIDCDDVSGAVPAVDERRLGGLWLPVV